MQIKTLPKNRKFATLSLAFAGIFLMFLGFLFNRVVSNVGFLLAGLYAIWNIKKIVWLFRDYWMWSFILLAILPLISNIWFTGANFYMEGGIMKCLLILFPAFVFTLPVDRKFISLVHYTFIIFMLISSIYSLYYYLADFSSMYTHYKTSKVMPVLSYSDHIRISWAVVISCLIAAYQWKSESSVLIKSSLIIYIVFQVVFLHLLGSKTGLISLYIAIIIWFGYSLQGRKKWLLAVVVPLILTLPFIAYKTIPTFEQRINFVRYDFELYSKGEYREGLSDAVRYYSLMAGKDIISKNALTGVGFNRLHDETASWYKKNIPELSSDSYFLPSSDIVIYWASGGILGLMVILFHIGFPFFKYRL
ncbi:MAG: O-antigen ligase family protein, partial [Saprospiraceae bacterium]|nr:O-antigen ligase family protein [Saprospiraceae bacterium]